VNGLAACWIGVYWGTPLGRSPLGWVVTGSFALLMARDLYIAADYARTGEHFKRDPRTGEVSKEKRSNAIVTHYAGAAVGALYYFFALRHAKRELLQARRLMAEAMQAVMDKHVATAAAAGGRSGALAPAASSALSKAAPVVGSTGTAPLVGPAPANEHMRTAPPAVRGRRGGRGYATMTRAHAQMHWVRRQQQMTLSQKPSSFAWRQF